ncbi:MAG: DUF4142 domain-containing protein [Steroidobacteraceae bacterium]
MKTFATFVAITVLAFPALSDDKSFIKKAAQGGMAEVEAGELAANKATNQEVRKFGMTMAKEHGAANKKLADLAKSKGIQLPSTMGEEHMETLEALQATNGPRFDAKYMEDMVKGHEEMLQLLKNEIASGQDAAVKAFAQEMLPTVESHLKEALRLTGKQSPASTN